MANSVPLLEGTDASGGYLVPTNNVGGIFFQRGLDRQAAVAQLATRRQVNGKREQYTEYVGRPTAAFVAEGAAKPVTGAEYAAITADVKKVATIVMYTEELIEDAQSDPTVLINQDVRAAFADLIDAHALGMANGTNLTTQFNSALRATTQTIELGTGADALPLAFSAAIETIQNNGYQANGAILGSGASRMLRDARDANGLPLYGGFQAQSPTDLYGLQLARSTNLASLSGTPGAGRIVGIVGDFTHALLLVRNDIRVKFTDQATIDVSGTLHHTWAQNKVASLWEARVGFVVHQLNTAFVAITNAT